MGSGGQGKARQSPLPMAVRVESLARVRPLPVSPPLASPSLAVMPSMDRRVLVASLSATRPWLWVVRGSRSTRSLLSMVEGVALRRMLVVFWRIWVTVALAVLVMLLVPDMIPKNIKTGTRLRYLSVGICTLHMCLQLPRILKDGCVPDESGRLFSS